MTLHVEVLDPELLSSETRNLADKGTFRSFVGQAFDDSPCCMWSDVIQSCVSHVETPTGREKLHVRVQQVRDCRVALLYMVTNYSGASMLLIVDCRSTTWPSH